jgi:hypothetical protein
MSVPDPIYEDAVGLSVVTIDDTEIGVVERALTSPSDLNQRYLVVRSTTLAGELGSDTLYVPDSDVRDVRPDRVVLDLEAFDLDQTDWTTPPDIAD